MKVILSERYLISERSSLIKIGRPAISMSLWRHKSQRIMVYREKNEWEWSELREKNALWCLVKIRNSFWKRRFWDLFQSLIHSWGDSVKNYGDTTHYWWHHCSTSWNTWYLNTYFNSCWQQHLHRVSQLKFESWNELTGHIGSILDRQFKWRFFFFFFAMQKHMLRKKLNLNFVVL